MSASDQQRGSGVVAEANMIIPEAGATPARNDVEVEITCQYILNYENTVKEM